MWNIFKRKKKTENEKNSISFPFLLTYAHKFVISWLMAKENNSHEEAMAQIFNRGCHELAKNCALEHLPVPPTQENAVQVSQTEPATRTRKVPFTNKAIPAGHLRFASYHFGNEKRRMVKFCHEDSKNLIKAGYQTFTMLCGEDGMDIFLFRNDKGSSSLLLAKYGRYIMIPLLYNIPRLNHVECADIPFATEEGHGCLILRIKFNKTIN